MPKYYLSLPSEILHLILSFYTSKFPGVIHFGTICKEWKEVADHSFIWSKRVISFYSPIEYFRSYIPNIDEDIEEERLILARAEVGNRRPLIIDINQTDFQCFAYRFKIEVHISGDNLNDNDDVENPLSNERTTTVSSPPLPFPAKQPLERAAEIRRKFMRIFTTFHRLWHWHIQHRPYSASILKALSPTNMRQNIYAAAFCTLFLPPASCLLLSDITNYPSSISEKNTIGFIVLYSFVFILIITLICSILHMIAAEIVYSLNLEIWKSKSKIDVYALLVLTFLLLGGGLSVALLQYKVSSTSSSFHYLYIPLPLWVFASLATALTYYMRKDLNQFLKQISPWLSWYSAFVALLSIPLGFSLIALRYDFPDDAPSLAIAMIPFYPLECVIYMVTVYSFADNFKEANRISRQVRSHPDESPYCKLSFAFIRSLCCVVMMIIAVAFTLIATLGSFRLSYGLIFGIGFVACFFLSVAAHLQTVALQVPS